MDNNNLNIHQAIRWGIMYYVGSSILVLPSTIATKAKQDSWISVVIVLLVQLLIAPLWILLAKQLRGRTIYTYIKDTLGLWLGSCTYLIWLIGYPFLNFIYTLRNLGDFITAVLMPETPIEVIHFVYLLVAVYGLRLGLTAIGRAAELFFIVFVFLVSVYSLCLVPEVHLSWLLPVASGGFKPILAGTLPLMTFPYMETLILCHLVPNLQDNRGITSFILKSIFISGFIFLVIIILSIVVLNPSLTSETSYPTYFMGMLINMGNFIERVEVLATMIWYITTFFRLILTLYVCALGLCEVLRIPDYKLAVVPLALLAMPLALVVWPNEGYHQQYFAAWGVYAFIPGLGYTLLLAAVAAWRQRSSVITPPPVS